MEMMPEEMVCRVRYKVFDRYLDRNRVYGFGVNAALIGVLVTMKLG